MGKPGYVETVMEISIMNIYFQLFYTLNLV